MTTPSYGGYPWDYGLTVKLIDAGTDQPIKTLKKGQKTKISAKGLDLHDLNVSLFVSKDSPLFGKIQTVDIDLNYGEAINTEGRGPYSLYDDLDQDPHNIDFLGGFIPKGKNEVTFDINLKNGGHKTITRDFSIVKKPKDFDVKVGIFDAHSDTLITYIKDGDYVPYSDLRHKKVTIAAFVHDYDPYDYKKVESMHLDYDYGHVTRIENKEPYSLLGDDYGDYYGKKGLIDKGDHKISLDLYSKDHLGGYYLGNETVNFTVYDDYYYPHPY